MTSISETHPEIVAENLFNYRNGRLLGLLTTSRWPEHSENGVSVRAIPDKYCTEAPCLSLFIERVEGGIFSELEHARVRLYKSPPIEADVRGEMRCIFQGSPIAEGFLDRGRVDLRVAKGIDVFVEIVRQRVELLGQGSPMLATAS